MRLISANSGTSSHELAEMMDIRPSSLTEMLNKLEESGIVVRTRDEKDLRVVRVSITELGTEELKRHNEEKRQARDFLTEGLSEEEQKTFCELCDRLVASAEKRNGELQMNGEGHCQHHMDREEHCHHHKHHDREKSKFWEEG